MNILIRHEQPKDIDAIRCACIAAFKTAPHSSHTEHKIIDALRTSGALTLSLVAEVDDQIVGHVAISPVTIEQDDLGWYGLGPISVVPPLQGNAVGSQLMYAVISTLKENAAQGCVLLGDPQFYQRFGFQPVKGLELAGVPKEYFQAISFSDEYPQGEVRYHQAFSI
jgi:predicted N-acetyltransferase YhbS